MENSGLSLYDGKGFSFIYIAFTMGFYLKISDVQVFGYPNSELCFSASAETSGKDQTISYDVSKLVDFPGFNVPAPYRMRDVCFMFFF